MATERDEARTAAEGFWQQHREAWAASGGKEMTSVLGMDVLQLNTVGRSSGEDRWALLTCLPADAGWLVVASNLGADQDPGWWKNLQAADGRGSVTIGGTTTPVRAHALPGGERDEAYARFVSTYDGYADYEKWTDRAIPVVALVPERG
jgi:deazaflavin-dependent oxidoreductase (nitroreductase family)